jgi:pre-rRNA-processing protein TSR4
LGFIEKGRENLMFKQSDWNNWDGGIIGGKPIWLNPVHIPRPEDLACSVCRDPLVFLLQIYCPLDIPDTAFHRAIYVFCCNKESCMNQGSIKCFRNQLAKENDFYDNNGDSNNNKIVESLPSLCEVCGCGATNVCSQCKVMRYCSRNHQKNHWKIHKLICGLNSSVDIDNSIDKDLSDNNASKSTQLNLLLPEYDLFVNQEELQDIGDIDKVDETVVNANIWEDASK